MNRLLRDRVYSANSQFTGTETIGEHVKVLKNTGEISPDQASNLTQTTLQCLFLSLQHDRIAIVPPRLHGRRCRNRSDGGAALRRLAIQG